MRRVVKQMAADGWLGIGWPKEYGGQGLGPIEQFIFFDESMRAGAPVPMLTINTVGPTIMEFGTQEQKDFFLPKILAGDIHFCIGYTEPGVGHRPGLAADPGGARRRRVRHQRAEDLHLAGRRRRLHLAGHPHRPRRGQAQGHLDVHRAHGHARASRWSRCTCSATTTSTTPSTRTCGSRRPTWSGGENQGWSLITNQLNHERVTLCSPGIIERALDDVAGVGPEHQAGRRPPGHRPGVGAGPPGPGLRPARVPQADQLEGGLDRHPGPPRRGRRLDHQGVRHRVLHGGLPAADGGGGPGRLPDPGQPPTRCWPDGSRCTPGAWSS